MLSAFYLQTAASVAVWWILVASAAQKSLYDVTQGSVVTVPSWLPKRCMLFLQRFRPVWFHGETIGLALATCFDQYDGVRIFAAILYTLYHLTESSVTNRHGEYPILYTMWAMCISDVEYRHACAWGIAIHCMLSTGYAKIAVGGLSPKGYPLWVDPSTIGVYLSSYRESRHKLSRPLLKSCSKFISGSRILCTAVAAVVLHLECFMAPATLLVAPEYRAMAGYGMIAMHIGIALCMSFKVGFVFLTSLPTYLYGFQCTATYGTEPWIVAASVGLGPTLISLLLMTIPENWPFTPMSLFMWNGKTTQGLLDLLMTGDTRMVLATASVASGHKDLKGLRVLHHGEVATEGEEVVHDCVLRTIGFTIIQGHTPMIEAAYALEDDATTSSEGVKQLVNRTWAWLSLDRRLVEAHTGEDLAHVYLVRVDESMRISEVLL